jgi:hypothetical protein
MVALRMASGADLGRPPGRLRVTVSTTSYIGKSPDSENDQAVAGKMRMRRRGTHRAIVGLAALKRVS